MREAQTDEQEDEEDEDASGSTDSDSKAKEATPGGRDDSATEGDERLHAVAAAWVRSADEAEQADQAGPGEGTEGAQKAQDADRGDTDEQDGKDGSERLDEGSEEASGADGTDESDADAETEGEAEVAPEVDADAAPVSTDTVDVPDAEEDGTTTADDNGDDADADATPEADEADEAAPEADAAKANGTDDVDAKSADETDADTPGTPPTDQPTAVFKAPRPSAPAVDQPTTMLKLGDAAKDVGKADDKAAETAPEDEDEGRGRPAPDPTPESPAERTSKFVPLKDLDDPDTRKAPKAGDSVTTALRVPPSASPAAASPVTPPAAATRSVPQVGPELTRQQPLPPKPPLDLLAELTNTPPPPETPLRTAVRRVKIWTPLVVLLVIVFAVVQNMRPLPTPTLELTAEDSHTFDGGKVDIPWPAAGQAALDVQGIGTFGSSGEQKPVPIASVAKVMTTYLILRDHPLKSGAEGPMIEIDGPAQEQADAVDESTVKVTAGDEISQREALEAVLIASANNVARLVARWDAGSEEAFVEKMNKAAEELGMTDTTYTDPSGLNNTTVSTAVDQVKLARAAMEQPAFREIAAMMSYDDYKGDNHPNWNQLVGSNGVVGIKTGTTTSALGNLVFAAKKEIDGETRTIVGAVVRQPAGGADNTILAGALSAGDRLIRAAQDALESTTVLKKGTVVGYADDGLGGRTPVAVTEDVKAVGWPGLKVKLTFAGEELPHQAKAGTKVGTLTVGDGTSSAAVKVPVALQEDLVEPGFTDKLTRLA
ncbi:D-alanyl-D-alanine carboxypeptidase [Streptomyces sp. GD-15H]|uniref:D-alanyl-D-alanine carboxypeptidase n=1 Tax=Streptomyces sp. GD-15H TaxID=3129112 RepID=UPI00324662D4